MKNLKRSQKAVLIGLAISIILSFCLSYTNLLLIGNLVIILGYILFAVTVGAIIYYIVLSKKKTIPIIISVAAIIVDILVNSIRIRGPLVWQIYYIRFHARWGGIFYALLIIFVALLVTFLKSNKNAQSQESASDYVTEKAKPINSETELHKENNIIENEELMKVVKTAICSQLKSPASAQFPAELISIIGDDERGYQVSGFVDSQNSYGAMIRNDFTATVIMENGFPVVKRFAVGAKANAEKAKQFGITFILLAIFVIAVAAISYFIIS